MTAQMIEIAGQKLVGLAEADYIRLCGYAEDNADAQAALLAEARHKAGEEYVPSLLIDRLASGDSPLRVWREHRSLTQQALAEKVGLSKMTISGIERGTRDTNSANWRRLADALAVDIDDLIPLTDGQE